MSMTKKLFFMRRDKPSCFLCFFIFFFDFVKRRQIQGVKYWYTENGLFINDRIWSHPYLKGNRIENG